MNIYSNLNTLNQELLHELFDYNDGQLHWKVSPKIGVNVGDIAGHIEFRGYKVIKIMGKKYKAHRLVFLYHNGYIPKVLDHIDNDRTNNRIENLRIATRGQNNQNAKIRKDNTSGVKGVFWNNRTQKWTAALQHNKQKWKKTFDTLEEAKIEIESVRMKLHKEFANHGVVWLFTLWWP